MHEPFTPPPATHFLTFRFVHYQGEEHPDTSKVVLTFDVKDLFHADVLRTVQAKHKFLLLAGPRWQPPSTAFIQRWNDALEIGESHLAAVASEDALGSVKIASSDLPHEAQNMKWCSDVLDGMIREANVCLHTNPGGTIVYGCAVGCASVHQVKCARRPNAAAQHCRLSERMVVATYLWPMPYSIQ